ncbi:hypothetical protein SAMN05421538_106207 [Paracoccus isoporae]|uniref:Uncharacterized protein n=1 Tax=Paracoccus isoporae TaxID=591205 RepID=A0A1G7CW52_9RHOB|nr:hypothetical protein [Paracoccus isoporae]SDE42715.1 hypothetical protein SAMN05421538_106207 [Paracoccus isoporae]
MRLTADQITPLFTRDGAYLCARWGRPVAPVIFGLADESLDVFRAAIRAVYAHAGQELAETDPESGANLMMFFCRDWPELDGIPDLDRLTGQPGMIARLTDAGAEHYQMFRFDAHGAIRACFSFVRMDGALADAHPAALAETLAVRSTLTFAHEVTASEQLARLIRAAYDPVMPPVARDPSHALRLAARLA